MVGGEDVGSFGIGGVNAIFFHENVTPSKARGLIPAPEISRYARNDVLPPPKLPKTHFLFLRLESNKWQRRTGN
jgi:hypothetical protein